MKRIIALAIILVLLIVGLGVGVPFAKYKSLDKVATLWSEALGGTSSFNPGKGWQDLTKTGGDIQAEARKVPAVQPAADLGKDTISALVQFLKDAVVSGYNFKFSSLPFVDKTPFLKDYTFGGLLAAGLGMLILVRAIGWGVPKVAPNEVKGIKVGTKNIWTKIQEIWAEFSAHPGQYLIMGVGVIFIIGIGKNIWDSGKPDSINEIAKFCFLPFFIVIIGEFIYNAVETLLIGWKLEGLVIPLRILVFVGIFFALLGSASGQPAFLTSFSNQVVGVPVPGIGQVFKYVLDQFALLAKDIRFGIGLISSAAIIYDNILGKRVQRS